VKRGLFTLALGAAFGLALSRIGFSSWDETHRMFIFADLRMFLTFALAVLVLALCYSVFRRLSPTRVHFTERPIHKGTLLGGAVFGIGWALCGSCPSIALVQLGEGQLGALVTLAGIFAGNYGYAWLRQSYLHWDAASCSPD
jgi:uncharacterized protein